MDIKKIYYSENKYFIGPVLYKPNIFHDKRGFFLESYNQEIFKNKIATLFKLSPNDYNFVQENHSFSKKGVLRGLHYQESPYSQGKLVRCIAGEVFDVIVDIRVNSPSFGKWAGINLSANNFIQLWIPTGFAHGFLAIKDNTELFYKTTNFWNKDYEKSIRWNDNTIKIKWPVQDNQYIISEKDSSAPLLKEIFSQKSEQ